MELREKNLTVQDIMKNLDGDSRTRQFVLEKETKKIPKGVYSKSVYLAYKEAIYEFIKGINKEKEEFERLYEETKHNRRLHSSKDCLKEIEEKINALDDEFDTALGKLGDWAETFKNKREQMRISSNETKLELFIEGVDYTVLDIKFEWEV